MIISPHNSRGGASTLEHMILFPKISFMTQQLSSQQIFYGLNHEILPPSCLTRGVWDKRNPITEFYLPKIFLLLNSYIQHTLGATCWRNYYYHDPKESSERSWVEIFEEFLPFEGACGEVSGLIWWWEGICKAWKWKIFELWWTYLRSKVTKGIY